MTWSVWLIQQTLVCGIPSESGLALHKGKFTFAVFALGGVLHFSPQRIGDELAAIADAEHGDAELRAPRGRYAGEAGSYTLFGPPVKMMPMGSYALICSTVMSQGFEVAIYLEVAHAARNELIVLPAEVEDEHALMLHSHFSVCVV